MALETSSPKEGAVREQQHETQPTRKEYCTLSKPEDVSTQHDIEESFTWEIVDVTGTCPGIELMALFLLDTREEHR
jgi:hypothetical protein